MKRLGTVFNERLPFNRAALSQALEHAATADSPVTAQTLRQGTSLGTNYVKATLRIAYGTGLFEQGPYRLSPLGKRVYAVDRNLTHRDTLWLLHYHLAAPLGPGPSWWHHIATTELRFGSRITHDDLSRAIDQYLRSSGERSIRDTSLKSITAFFAGTYVDRAGLGGLGLLADVSSGSAPREYELRQPDGPSPEVTGYCLAHMWKSVWGDARVVNLDELLSPSSLASVLLMGSYSLSTALQHLGSLGLVRLHQVAPPYQLERGWQNPDELIDVLYA